MLKAGDLARREDRRVKGFKIGKTRRDRGISHVCLSTTLGVANDVESRCKVKNITVPANFANVIMPRRHAQNGVIDDLHSTTVYFRVFTNFFVKW